jgi:hypothetical protein
VRYGILVPTMRKCSGVPCCHPFFTYTQSRNPEPSERNFAEELLAA